MHEEDRRRMSQLLEEDEILCNESGDEGSGLDARIDKGGKMICTGNFYVV